MKNQGSKIAYITAQAPWGRGETYIIDEMLALEKRGGNLLIIPRSPTKEIFHIEAVPLLKTSIWLPLLNFKITTNFLLSLAKIETRRILKQILLGSKRWHILAKNLVVFPKSVFIARLLKEKGNVEHIHAHWGSTTSTMAYVISQITGIPWSFTLHRWDIVENNMLKEKVKSAKFVRCISAHGKNELLKIIGKDYKEKIRVIHMGVKVSGSLEFEERKHNLEEFTIATPANLLEVKGHKYLVEACSVLIEQDINNFQCIFYGEGPLRAKLERIVKERKLASYIKMLGAIPHEKLIAMYKNHKVDLVILPSITTNKGEHEGIPVSLMEAMAYGIPVISTSTGGIPELIGDDSGIMVEEKNARAIADAIKKLMIDKKLYRSLNVRGKEKILKEFNIEKNVKSLLFLFETE